MAKEHDENPARKIQAHITVLHVKLRDLETYLVEPDERFQAIHDPSQDIVEEAVIELQLCIDCVDRIEEIVKRIK